MPQIRLLCVFLCLMSCGSSKESSTQFLKEDQMIQVLRDMHRLESQVSAMQFSSTDTAIVVYHKMEQQLFKKHGIDSLQFEQSFQHYVKDPKAYQALYEKVIQSMEASQHKPKGKKEVL